jgi:hypothetical protein
MLLRIAIQMFSLLRSARLLARLFTDLHNQTAAKRALPAKPPPPQRQRNILKREFPIPHVRMLVSLRDAASPWQFDSARYGSPQLSYRDERHKEHCVPSVLECTMSSNTNLGFRIGSHLQFKCDLEGKHTLGCQT